MNQTLTAADTLLDQWPHLRRSERIQAFAGLPRENMDDFFLGLDVKAQSELVLALPAGQRRLFVRLLAPDDAADLIQASPQRARQELMALMDDTTREETTALLDYREDVAGGLMNPRFARLRPEESIEQAITYLRQQLSQVELIFYAYVLDEHQRLLGIVSLKDLVTADRSKTVADVMTTKIFRVSDVADEKDIAHLLTTHKLKAIPVVDAQNRMKGIVTAEDVIEVIREMDTRDMQRIGGMEALDGPYFETGFLAMLKKRAGWLVILFVGEMFTATAMSHYERQIEAAVVLALFIPLLISSGGNSGSQATTLIIRAMSLGEVRLRDWRQVIRRELTAGIALGVLLGAIGFLRIVVWQSVSPVYGQYYLLVAATIFLSLLGVVTFGSVAGSMLPFILRGVGLDPASASAPFVATLVDVTGIIIYFSVARLVLSGTLL
jgi:magnesium transporter